MDPDEIKEHWEVSASTFATGLSATTKTATIKRLEIDALRRRLERRAVTSILEVGCGNGHNCVALAQALPGAFVTGVDFVDQMVASARALAQEAGVSDRTRFVVGDATGLDEIDDLDDGAYDAVLTVRCVINIPDPDDQAAAVAALARKVRPGGLLLLLENVVQTHARQNALRASVGLEPRQPAAFNRFLDDDLVRTWPGDDFTLVEVEDFAALHDLVLYVLVPLATGSVEYDHPLVEAATEILLADPGAEQLRGFPAVGQNRMYVFARGQ